MNVELNELVRKLLRKYIIAIPRRRAFVDFLINENKENMVGVEIGSSYGENALDMLKNLSIKKLYLIDPYKPYEEENKVLIKHTKGYYVIKRRLEMFRDRVKIIPELSEKAVKSIQNNLDFVYVDGNHDYKFVKKDIELYWPKLKRGGIMGGHDFLAMHLGVCKAVIEFITKKHVELHGDGIDWWVIKG